MNQYYLNSILTFSSKTMTNYLRNNYQKIFTRKYNDNRSYQTSGERDLRYKQSKFPKLTHQIYVQNKEVKTQDNYSIVDKLIDSTEPHELHLIKKIRSVVGEPNWVKHALKKLGFFAYPNKEWKVIYIIKPNIKEINDMLWYCKHLVKIIPIKFKNGFPSDKDIGNTKLNLETGEFNIIKKIDTFNNDEKKSFFKVNNVNVTTNLKTNETFRINRKEMHQNFHRQKQLCQLNEEYFPTQYDYKYDQDKPGVIRIKGKADCSIKEDELQNSK